MLQIINFSTWSRIVNGIKKESTLDHVYIKDITNIRNFYPVTPEIGDHKIIVVEIIGSLPSPTTMIKHNWRKYSPELLVTSLSVCNFEYNITDVQQYWNRLENDIVTVVDKIAPLTEFTNNHTTNSSVNSQVRPLIQKKEAFKNLQNNEGCIGWTKNQSFKRRNNKQNQVYQKVKYSSMPNPRQL